MNSIRKWKFWPTAYSQPLESLHRPEPRRSFLFIGIFVGIVAILHGGLAVSTRGDGRGLISLRSGHDFEALKRFRLFAIQLPLNILAGLLVISSDYVRNHLLAPPRKEGQLPELKVRYESLTAWKRTTIYRKLLWLTLLLTGLSIDLFFNSLILFSTPSYDAYEVLVDQSFFTGRSSNISGLDMTQFDGQKTSLIPYDTSQPSQWPGMQQLQQFLNAVQLDSSKWTNISTPDCKRKYGLDQYSDYRTVLLVVNWNRTVDSNSSALAIGALPGFPVPAVANRFVSLCPKSYVLKTPGAKYPGSAPYVGSIHQPSQSKGSLSPDPKTRNISSIDQYALIQMDGLTEDLCYGYGPTVTERNPYNKSRGLPLLYCLSEPIREATARIVWCKPITWILAMTFGIKTFAILLSWLCIRYDSGFRGGYPWHVLERECSHRLAMWLYAIINVVIFVLTLYLSCQWTLTSGQSFTPNQSADQLSVAPIAAYPNVLHTILRLRAFFESNQYQRNLAQSLQVKHGYKFDTIFFFWNLTMHLLVSAWISTAVTDRYPLTFYEDPAASPTTSLVWGSSFHAYNFMSNEIAAGLPAVNIGLLCILGTFPITTFLLIQMCISLCANKRRLATLRSQLARCWRWCSHRYQDDTPHVIISSTWDPSSRLRSFSFHGNGRKHPCASECAEVKDIGERKLARVVRLPSLQQSDVFIR